MILFVHIGSHKTGTTAIQRFAANNSDWLAERGLIYPNMDLIDLERRRSHLAVFSGLCDLPGFDYGVDRQDALKFLVAAARYGVAQGRSVLLSAESIFRMSGGVKDVAFGVLAGAFSGYDIRVIAGLRRQDRLFESMYRNDFKADRSPPTLQRALKRREEMLDYEGMLHSVEKWFPGGEHMLLPYAEATRATFVRDFFAAMGVSVPDDMMPGRVANVSYDVVDCLALRELFRRRASPRERQEFRAFIANNQVKTTHKFVSPEIRDMLRGKYSEGNERIIYKYPELESELSWSQRGEPGDEVANASAMAADVDRRLQGYQSYVSQGGR